MARKGQGRGTPELPCSRRMALRPPRHIAQHVAGPTAGFIGTGPGQWLAVSERLANGDLAADLARRLTGLCLDLRPERRAGGDPHRGTAGRATCWPRACPSTSIRRCSHPGSAATSVISLMGVTLWQVDDAPTYDIAVFRSLAGGFWKWLCDSAAEYRYAIGPPQNARDLTAQRQTLRCAKGPREISGLAHRQ